MGLIKCSECGKEVSDKAKSCPNCGAPVGRSDKTNAFAITGFVFSIISIFFHVYAIVPVLACVFSLAAFNDIDTTHEKGRGLAVAGLIIGVIYILAALYEFFVA